MRRRYRATARIGRAFGKSHVSIHFLLSQHGGIVPAARRRSLLTLTLAEREDISRGITSGSSIREIAKGLERVVSTVSRQREALKLATEDMKNHEIALKLGLTDHTVRNYIVQIFEKLGVSTRVGLVLYALSEPTINERPPAA